MTDQTLTAEQSWDAHIELPSPRKNMPVTFGHRIEAFLSRRVLGYLRKRPIEKAAKQMGGLIRTIGPMLHPIHARGHENLKLVYPDMTAAERAAILRDAWENLGMLFAEFAHLPELPGRVTIENRHILDDVIQNEKKVIFFSGHLANWEIMASTLYASGLKYGAIYRAANNPLIDEDIIRIRSQIMSNLMLPKNKRASRNLLQTLADGYSLCLLSDQKLNEGIASKFLGHTAHTSAAAQRIALKQGIPMIPIQPIRHPGSRFTIKFHEPLHIERSDNLDEDVERLTLRLNEVLGQMVLEHPGQWLWFHRRWPRKLAG